MASVRSAADELDGIAVLAGTAAEVDDLDPSPLIRRQLPAKVEVGRLWSD